MNKKLFVGSLPYTTSEAELRDAFSPFGTIQSVRIIMDKFSGRSKGFGFVEMSSEEEAQKAMEAMNGKELGGRTLTVGEAKPEQPRLPRGDGFSNGRGSERPRRNSGGRRESRDRFEGNSGNSNRDRGRRGGPGFDDDNFGNR